MDQPEFRVGGKQPGNLYRVTAEHPEGERFGFVLRDEDGPMVAVALNAFVDGGRPRGEADSEDARRGLGVCTRDSESAPPSTDDLREQIAAAAYGADCRYHGTDRGATDAQLWADSHYVKDGKDYAERGHYRLMAGAALSVVAPLLEASDAEIERLRDKAANAVADQAMLKGLSVEEGAAVLELAPPRELVIAWVDAARKMLGDAENYSETRVDFPAVSMDIKAAGEFERYVFTVQRAGKVTPHEARKHAEAKAAEYCRLYQSEVDRVAELTRERDALQGKLSAAMSERLDAVLRVDGLTRERDRLLTGPPRLCDDCSINYRAWSGRPVAQEAEGPWPGAAHTAALPLNPPTRRPRVWKQGDPEPEDRPPVRDCQGDTWRPSARADTVGQTLWWSAETALSTWEHVARKWSPLTEVLPEPPADLGPMAVSGGLQDEPTDGGDS